MTAAVLLPGHDRRPVRYQLLSPRQHHPRQAAPAHSRVAYAAAHVVADPWVASTAAGPGCVDWEATLGIRERLWKLGLGVAEAMDTAQRGMGLSWPDVQRLVRETLEAGKAARGATVVGVATDTLPPGSQPLVAIVDAYLEQLGFVEDLGGSAVIMASRQLAASARGIDDYLTVYDAVLAQARRPVILHWLGSAFDPALRGYWGTPDLDRATQVVTDLLQAHRGGIEGIKVSLLQADREVALRAKVPTGVKVFTGDDFNYVELIEGRDTQFSHALLGAFTAIAPVARAALGRLDEGDVEGYRDLLEPTLTLSRLIFETPTAYYKSGIVWLAYLQGHQQHFRMLGGLESGRSVEHLVKIFVEADRLGLFEDPDLAADRMRGLLALHGLG
jgi:hypothetical protein